MNVNSNKMLKSSLQKICQFRLLLKCVCLSMHRIQYNIKYTELRIRNKTEENFMNEWSHEKFHTLSGFQVDNIKLLFADIYKLTPRSSYFVISCVALEKISRKKNTFKL